VRPEYERNSPRMSSNSYVNLKIATCLVRYADDRLIDQRFPSEWNAGISRMRLTAGATPPRPLPLTPRFTPIATVNNCHDRKAREAAPCLLK
ncbi:hypothetical protein, partial [Burkholderia cenocepacia]|uniref:hypothetical protein n=1 Tax=Burkholderia cenocepacia TaxID=95486 RepID=UPI002B248E61